MRAAITDAEGTMPDEAAAAEPKVHGLPPLPNEFEIPIPSKPGDPWNAGNGVVGLTVFQGLDAQVPSKHLANGTPWHVWKANEIRQACTPAAHKHQWLVAELNGVFVHVHHDHETGRVAIVIAPKRLN